MCSSNSSKQHATCIKRLHNHVGCKSTEELVLLIICILWLPFPWDSGACVGLAWVHPQRVERDQAQTACVWPESCPGAVQRWARSSQPVSAPQQGPPGPGTFPAGTGGAKGKRGRPWDPSNSCLICAEAGLLHPLLPDPILRGAEREGR